MTELWLASSNPKKRGELARLLEPLGVRVRGMEDAAGFQPVAEGCPTFAGNARLKATALARHVRGHALGDDSGLCVAALGGAPGVRSARWAGPDATDEDRITKLLRALEGEQDRRAHFVCALCVAGPDGRVVVEFEESCAGTIATTSQGASGFGYDPVFRPDALAYLSPQPTFAELSAEGKDAVSHRGKALRRLTAWLRDHFGEPPTTDRVR